MRDENYRDEYLREGQGGTLEHLRVEDWQGKRLGSVYLRDDQGRALVWPDGGESEAAWREARPHAARKDPVWGQGHFSVCRSLAGCMGKAQTASSGDQWGKQKISEVFLKPTAFCGNAVGDETTCMRRLRG